MNFYSILFDLKKDFINKNEISSSFKLPIEYLNDKILLSNNIINDLELKELKQENDVNEENEQNKDNNITEENEENKDNEKNNFKKNIYYSLLNPESLFEKQIINKWSDYYTNNKEYLLETQTLLKTFKNNVTIIEENNNSYDDNSIYNNCENIFYDDAFIEKFQYFDLPFFNTLNKDAKSLTFLSIYNLSSPLISLILPIISLILPYLIIKLQGYEVTFDLYMTHLKTTFKNQAFGYIFEGFSDQPISSKIYIIVSIFFYFFQVYQNIMSCIKYFTNIEYIHNILFELRTYLKLSINNGNNLIKYTKQLTTYSEFNNELNVKLNNLTKYYNKLKSINNYEINFNKILELGNIMKCFYMLNNDNNLIESLYYSFNLNGYIKNILNIQKLIKSKKMNYCVFNNSNEKTCFKKSFYGYLLNSDFTKKSIVKNSYDLSKNLILTGPNAAGKTTLLKSTLFNIILSQQLGCGFYESANIKIYDYIHCYLNIPETSNRDSLFQAEARQCKEILKIIEENKDKTHFCVFDELYSGTNPDDAIKSGYNYLKYLNKYNNIDYILTTHYYKLCKKMNKNENSKIQNYYMEIIKNEEDFKCTYKIKNGISKEKGGLKVLKELCYPKEILNKF